MRERAIRPNELLTWAEACTVVTPDHPQPWEGWNFSERFPQMPFVYRRSAIKDAIGKADRICPTVRHWLKRSGSKRASRVCRSSRPPNPVPRGLFSWKKDARTSTKAFSGSRSIPGSGGAGPIIRSRTAVISSSARRAGWENKNPSWCCATHQPSACFTNQRDYRQEKSKSKLDPDLVTVAVDLNVKNLAVITVRQQGRLDRNRLCHRSWPRPGIALSASEAYREKAVAIGQASQGRTQ